MIDKKRLFNTLLDLLKIDAPPKKERLIADHIINFYKKLDIPLTEDNSGSKIGGNTGNLIGKIEGHKKRSPIAFIAHMDRVESTKGQKPIISEDRVSSNGKTVLGADNCAGIALICELVKFIKEKKIKHSPLEIIFTVAEEVGLLGSKNMDYNNIKSRTAFILDAGGHAGDIVTKSPGIEKFTVIIKGKAAHAGVEPEKGINSIAIAGKAISKIKQGRVDDETTLNIGKIKGGKATNIVPENVSIEGEVRSFNNNSLENQIETTRKNFSDISKEFGGSIEFNHTSWCTTYSLKNNSLPVTIAVSAAKGISLNYNIRHSGGGSDANFLNENNIQSICLGIGMFDMHTKKEYILLEDLYKSLDWLLEIIKGES